MEKKIRNIAIMAHVDAGKTSVTEQLLFQSGMTKELGSVDKGTSSSDFLSIERERGISVQASTLVFDWKEYKINILDTPGHADFMAEVERSLLAVDAVVLIVSAAEGVQAQTHLIWELLQQNNIPTLIFINKLDREGVVLEEVLEEIHSELTKETILLQKTEMFSKITSIWNKESYALIDSNIEKIVEQKDELLEAFIMEEDISFHALDKALVDAVYSAKLFPVLYGIAKNGVGIEYLLDAIIHFLPNPTFEEEFSAIAYKIRKDKNLGRICYLRVLGGELKKKDEIYNQRLGEFEKANQLKAIFSNKLSDVEAIGSGEIGVVSGFQKVRVGDILGETERKVMELSQSAILTTRIKNKKEEDYHALAEALYELNMEEPSLQFEWLKEDAEFHLRVKGWIQMQIMESILREQYGIETSFENPQVIYKETPALEVVGYEEYTMPKPCWAVIKLHIEPMSNEYGVSFHSNISVDEILLKYQKEVERTISKALKQGVKGWEVTDVKITLIGGEDHNIHSRAGDFVIATPMAIMNGLKEVGTILLEPILKFKIIASETMLGKIASDLTQMRATFSTPNMDNGKFQMEGKIPLATSMDYPVKLNSRSGGKAKIFTQFDSYQKVKTQDGMIRAFRGISPLDRAKYILQARKAIQ